MVEGGRTAGEKEGLEQLSAVQERQHHVWYLIDPNQIWVACWDGLTSLTLLFVAIFTPFEVTIAACQLAA